jgi:hypothetical protein
MYRSDRDRSIPVSRFEPLARCSGVRLLSLQKHDGVEQLHEVADRFPVIDLGSRLDEASGAFMDTAAVMMNLDLVVTSDTAIAHLAGALGAAVWVAIPFAPDWRWLLDRSDSPWYPTMRLFRQERRGDWQGVFRRIEAALGQQNVMATISEALAIAIQHHQAGRLQAAEQIYRQILAAGAESSRCVASSRRDCPPGGQA